MMVSQDAHALPEVPAAPQDPHVALQNERSMLAASNAAMQESETAMTDFAFGTASRAAAAPAATAVERKGLFARMLDAIYEARMRQAEREVRRYLHLVPKNVLEQTEFDVSRYEGSARPFDR
jgi:hypothetical protein